MLVIQLERISGGEHSASITECLNLDEIKGINKRTNIDNNDDMVNPHCRKLERKLDFCKSNIKKKYYSFLDNEMKKTDDSETSVTEDEKDGSDSDFDPGKILQETSDSESSEHLEQKNHNNLSKIFLLD